MLSGSSGFRAPGLRAFSGAQAQACAQPKPWSPNQNQNLAVTRTFATLVAAINPGHWPPDRITHLTT